MVDCVQLDQDKYRSLMQTMHQRDPSFVQRGRPSNLAHLPRVSKSLRFSVYPPVYPEQLLDTATSVKRCQFRPQVCQKGVVGWERVVGCHLCWLPSF